MGFWSGFGLYPNLLGSHDHFFLCVHLGVRYDDTGLLAAVLEAAGGVGHLVA